MESETTPVDFSCLFIWNSLVYLTPWTGRLSTWDSITAHGGHLETISSLTNANLPTVDTFSSVTSKSHPLGSHHTHHQKSWLSIGKLSKILKFSFSFESSNLIIGDKKLSVMFSELTGSLCSICRKCLPKSKSDNCGLSFSCCIKQKWCFMKNVLFPFTTLCKLLHKCLPGDIFLSPHFHPGQHQGLGYVPFHHTWY